MKLFALRATLSIVQYTHIIIYVTKLNECMSLKACIPVIAYKPKQVIMKERILGGWWE